MVAEPVEIPDADHEVVIERAAAIDVAKATGTVCVRLPGKSGRRFSRVWEVSARTGVIGELAQQLIELEVEKVMRHEVRAKPATVSAHRGRWTGRGPAAPTF